MVVDLAVEDDRVAAVLGEDRLVTAGDVDDAEAAHAEAEVAVGEHAAVVGPAMDDGVALPGDDARRHRAPGPPIPSRYSTH